LRDRQPLAIRPGTAVHRTARDIPKRIRSVSEREPLSVTAVDDIASQHCHASVPQNTAASDRSYVGRSGRFLGCEGPGQQRQGGRRRLPRLNARRDG
jgi:hypothetical protein